MRTATVTDYHQAIARAVTLALGPGDGDFPDVAALADAAGFSAFHFSRMFAGMLGESPGEFLRRLRLERAAYQLRTGANSVTQIALDAGYESPEAFCRAFRAAYFRPPSAFADAGLIGKLPSPNGLHYQPDRAVVAFVPKVIGGVPMQVDVRDEVPARRVVAMRHVGPYWQISPVFERLQKWCETNHVKQVGPGVAIYHDDPESVPEPQLRSDACATVADDFTTDDPSVAVFDIGGGRYAVTTYYGDYSGLGAAWGRFIGEWIPQSGETIDEIRPCFEEYVNLCGTVPLEQVRTDLYQAVR